MRTASELDRRIDDWLEDGAQMVPDWLVEDALARAHATPQLGAGVRLPWVGRRIWPPLSRLAPVLAGAVGALVVLTAFVLGLISAPRIGNEPTPTPNPVISPSASPGQTPVRTAALPRSAAGVQVFDVLPGETDQVYGLSGLTATREAVWMVAVTADSITGDPINRLIRIEAATGDAQVVPIPGAVGNLSPPIADGETVWTASSGGLHSVDATGSTEPRTVPLSFHPGEVDVSAEGVWVTRTGGTNLVNPETGEILRHIEAHPGSRLGRILGAPVFGSLWECAAGSLLRVDPVSGAVTATIELPADDRDRCRHGIEASGIDGMDDRLLPLFANVAIDPLTNTVATEFDLGEWSDAIQIDGRLWFEAAVPGFSQPALVEFDPETGLPLQTILYTGTLYSNTAFMSDQLAVAGDYVWILADPTPDTADGPQIVAVPLAEL